MKHSIVKCEKMVLSSEESHSISNSRSSIMEFRRFYVYGVELLCLTSFLTLAENAEKCLWRFKMSFVFFYHTLNV